MARTAREPTRGFRSTRRAGHRYPCASTGVPAASVSLFGRPVSSRRARAGGGGFRATGEPMTEILTESFCERCGTRYTFEPVQPKRRGLGEDRHARARVPALRHRPGLVPRRGVRRRPLRAGAALDDPRPRGVPPDVQLLPELPPVHVRRLLERGRGPLPVVRADGRGARAARRRAWTPRSSCRRWTSRPGARRSTSIADADLRNAGPWIGGTPETELEEPAAEEAWPEVDTAAGRRRRRRGGRAEPSRSCRRGRAGRGSLAAEAVAEPRRGSCRRGRGRAWPRKLSPRLWPSRPRKLSPRRRGRPRRPSPSRSSASDRGTRCGRRIACRRIAGGRPQRRPSRSSRASTSTSRSPRTSGAWRPSRSRRRPRQNSRAEPEAAAPIAVEPEPIAVEPEPIAAALARSSEISPRPTEPVEAEAA